VDFSHTGVGWRGDAGPATDTGSLGGMQTRGVGQDANTGFLMLGGMQDAGVGDTSPFGCPGTRPFIFYLILKINVCLLSGIRV
jgi:hypothetical protein